MNMVDINMGDMGMVDTDMADMDMVDIDMVFTNIVDMDMADMDHFADLSRKFGLLSSKFFIEQYLSSSFSFGFP